MRFSDLWRWDGRIGRVPYALTGLIAFVLKYSLDRFIAASAFGREWPLSGYWISPFGSVKLAFTLQDNASFIATLLAMALPFIWLGVVLTIRRLRSVGWPIWLVVLFFLPFLNLVFFFLLCILPAAQEEKLPENRRRWLEAVVPKGPIAAAAVAVLLVSLVSVPIVWLSTVVFEDYGWGAFVGVPFFLGLVSVMIYGYRAPPTVCPLLRRVVDLNSLRRRSPFIYRHGRLDLHSDGLATGRSAGLDGGRSRLLDSKATAEDGICLPGIPAPPVGDAHYVVGGAAAVARAAALLGEFLY